MRILHNIKHSLALLLLGLGVLLPGSSFAATAFPYFGPLKTHELHIEQGFYYAHMIREMIATPSSALFYLALTGALVGFFLIVVKADNRRPTTLFCWGVLVLTLIISPVGSKLLFTSITVDDINVSNPNVPIGTESVYAFTPQAAAFHVVSNIHEILLAFFKGKGFVDEIDAIAARQELMAADSIILSPEILERVRKLAANDCRLPLTLSDLQDETADLPRYAGSASTTSTVNNDGYGVTTLRQAVAKLNAYYASEDRSSPPPYIMFFSSESDLNKAGISDTTSYVRGIDTLYYDITGSHLAADATVADAVAALKATGFGGNGAIDPSYGLSYAVDFSQTTSDTDSITINSGKLTAQGYDGNPNTPGYYTGEDWTQKFQTAKENGEQSYLLDNDYYSLSSRDANRLALANLKVGVANVIDDSGFSSVAQLSVPLTCAGDSNSISEDIIDSLFKVNTCAASATASTVKGIMMGTTPFPSTPLSVPMTQPPRCQHLPAVVKVLNSVIERENATGSSDPRKRAIFVDNLISSSVAATRNAIANQTTATNQMAEDANNPEMIRGVWNSGIGRAFAGLAFDITEGILKTVVQVIGFIALLFVKFLTVLINVAMTGILVVTPFAMLVGLVIPSNAFGILVFVTVSCFVLKMVPITYLILNVIFAILFNALGNS